MKGLWVLGIAVGLGLLGEGMAAMTLLAGFGIGEATSEPLE